MYKIIFNIIFIILSFSIHFKGNSQVIEGLKGINEIFEEADKISEDSIAFKLGNNALNKSLLTNNDSVIASAYFHLARLYEKRNRFEDAKIQLKIILDRSYEKNHHENMIKAKCDLARVERRLMNFESAVDYATETLRECDSLNMQGEKAKLLYIISESYYFKELYTQSKEFCEEAKELFISVNDSVGLFHTENQFGLLEYIQGRPEKAMPYFKKAMKIAENIDYEVGLAMTYNNIAMIKFELGQYDEYISLMNKCMKIQKKYNDLEKLATGYNNIGYFYFHIGNQQKALKNLLKSVNLAKEAGFKVRLVQTFDNLSLVYMALNDYKKAYQYRDSSAVLEDSINQIESKKILTEMKAQYELEKKELLIEKQTVDLEKNRIQSRTQKMVNWFFAGFILFGLFFTFLILRMYLQKNKVNKQLIIQKDEVELKNKQLVQAKEEVEAQHETLISHKNKVELQKMEIDSSIEYASRIQKAIIGGEGRITDIFKEAFVILKPLSTVSGDFYWFGQENDHKIVIAADCTGHGVPAALMTVIGHDFLEEIISGKGITKPDEILYQLDEKINKRLNIQDERFDTISDGMDIAVISINKKDKKFYFSGAKTYAFLISDGVLEELKGSGNTMGGSYLKKTFELYERDLKSGDLFYIFSDGFQDQFGGTDQSKYKKRRFREFISKISGLALKDQEKYLQEELKAWQGNNPQTDDILIIGVRD